MWSQGRGGMFSEFYQINHRGEAQGHAVLAFKFEFVYVRPAFTPCAPLAQLDRASDYGSEGRGFESSGARQFLLANAVSLEKVSVLGGDSRAVRQFLL